jgi:hypothetical protein
VRLSYIIVFIIDDEKYIIFDHFVSAMAAPLKELRRRSSRINFKFEFRYLDLHLHVSESRT